MNKHILSQRVILPFDISLKQTIELHNYLHLKFKGSKINNKELNKLYKTIVKSTHINDI